MFFDRVAPSLPKGGLNDVTLESLRTTFIERVRGRGPLPMLRVGQQPYGLLPAGDLEHWAAPAGDPVEGGLVSFLRQIRTIWGTTMITPSAAPR